MKLNLKPQDRQRLKQLQETFAQNRAVTRLYSQYLNCTPRFLTADLVNELADTCGLSEQDAFRTLLSAACGLDSAENPEHRRLERLYLQPGIHLLNPDPFRNNPYQTVIRFPELQAGKWTFCQEHYAPYEPFVCGHPELNADFREIPQIGAFREEYRFPALLESGVEWMTVTPNEMETMREPIAQASGDVVTFGLGLGYFAFCVSEKPSVRRVTVVERDATLISLFCEHLLPQFPHREKLRIVCSDAFDYAEHQLRDAHFDTAFVDLWHDPSDGLELYIRMKHLEPLSPNTRFSYWIEPSLLSCLREMVLERISDQNADFQTEITSYDELTQLLSSHSLRRLAGQLRRLDAESGC